MGQLKYTFSDRYNFHRFILNETIWLLYYIGEYIQPNVYIPTYIQIYETSYNESTIGHTQIKFLPTLSRHILIYYLILIKLAFVYL